MLKRRMINKFKRIFFNTALGIKISRNTSYSISKSAKIIFLEQNLYMGATWIDNDPFPSLLVLRDDSTLTVNNKFKVYSGSKIYVNKNAHLKLGSGYINHNLNLSCFNRIEIGENVAISENVTIRDSDNHVFIDSSKPMSSPIFIGNNVWIGMNVTILKGVTIGDGAVVGAGSIVNKDVLPNSLVGGVPARTIKENIHWK